MARALACIVLTACMLASAATASATVVPRLAAMEAPTSSPFDLDQAVAQCEKSSATRDTTLAYAGNASLKVHTENEDETKCKAIYARGIFETNSPYHLVEGDTFWFGAAIYLPKGFYEAHTNYTDLLRIDSYVNDKSESTPFEKRAEINFASWENDDLYVRAAMGGTNEDLIGPISPTALPEGAWNWVEIQVKLGSTEYWSLTQLKVNGKTIGTSTLPNLFAEAAPLNRLRYGIVSSAESGSGNLTAYFDRTSISHTERGPTPSSTENRVSLWRLNEANGTTAADTMGAAPGTYANAPILDLAGIVGAGLDTAVSFDGVNDHVAIVPTAPLDIKGEVTLEAWVKADALQGSVIRRNNSYELRPQSDGSVLFRVWIGGTVQSLTSAKGTVSTGDIHHLVGTYDGTSLKIYIDGSQVASQSQTGTMTHEENTLYIGRNDGSGTYFDGIIDEVAIYSDALTAETVLDHFEEGETRDESLDQLSNPSATTDLSGWSTPSLGTLTRSTSDLYSAPASFLLAYKGGAYQPVVTTVSDEVITTLEAGESYTFRFRSRFVSGAGLDQPSGGCIRLFLSNSNESVHCVNQPSDKSWRLRGITFEPTVEVEAYRVEFTLDTEGFLEIFNGSMSYDDIELIAAG